MNLHSATARARTATRAPLCPRPNLRQQQREDRRQRFLEVAEEMFLAHGFAGASVNELVRKAGGSLATLYAEFGTKEQLFHAVINRRAAELFTGDTRAFAARGDVASELHHLATRMQARILSPDSLAMYRLGVSEGPRFAELRKTMLTAGLQQFLKRLAGYFKTLAATGKIAIDKPQLAAERFLSLVQGQELFIAACGDAVTITPAARARHVRQAVDAFLRIYPLRH